MQRQLLLARLRAVIIATTSFFQHLCRPATFRRPAEYQYHAAKVRKSEKKNKGNIFF
jgi:formate-dependent nitrite reductase membrane component NrfD